MALKLSVTPSKMPSFPGSQLRSHRVSMASTVHSPSIGQLGLVGSGDIICLSQFNFTK